MNRRGFVGRLVAAALAPLAIGKGEEPITTALGECDRLIVSGGRLLPPTGVPEACCDCLDGAKPMDFTITIEGLGPSFPCTWDAKPE